MSTVSIESEMAKNKDLVRSVIEEVRSWCDSQIYGPYTTDLDIANFLHCCWYKPDKAKETIDAYYKIRSFASEIFMNRDPCLPSILDTFRIMSYAILPKKTANECQVIYTGLYQLDPEVYVFSDVMKCLHMVVDMHLNEIGTEKGFVFIFDMKGITFAHVMKIDISTMRNIMFYIQYAIPVRINEIHFVNMDRFSGAIISLIQPFMTKDIREKMNFHTEGNESFYKLVPKEILPTELGGIAASLEIMRSQTFAKVIDNRDFFTKENKCQIPKNLIFSDTPFKHNFFENDFNRMNLD